MTDEEKKVAKDKEDAYLLAAYQSLEKAKREHPNLFDHDLPTEPAPDAEWVFPGRCHTHHPNGHARTLRAEANLPRNASQSAAMIARADELDKVENRQLRALFRMHSLEDYKGKRRAIYNLVHSHGHHTAVWHTYPKDQWSEDEAKEFHTARINHPDFNKPKMTIHEFNRHVKKQIALQHGENLLELQKQQPKSGGK